MHRGLKSTLMTVAVALLGLKAMAMAPTISQLPDVIIGDAEAVTGGVGLATEANHFVFPDAFDVDGFAEDDNTSDSNLLWSFSEPSGNYSINARTSTDGSDLDAPSAAHSLDGGDDPDTADLNLRTLTFRSIQHSPLPKVGAYPDPGTPAGVPSDGQPIILIASDGTTHTSSDPFMAYIVNDGSDELSGFGVTLPPIDFTGSSTNGWTSRSVVVIGGTATFSGPGANGICVNVSAAGTNIAGWESAPDYTGLNSPYSTVSLVDNAVYQIRLTVTTTASGGLVPLWYLGHQNTIDSYGGAYLFFDNGPNAGPGGANAPAPAGTRSIFEAWVNAPAMSTSAFKNEVFLPANAALKDFRLRLLTLDVGDNPGNPATDPYGAASDTGAVCWKRIDIDRFDISFMQVQSTPYNNLSLVQAVDTAAGVANTQPGAVNVADYSGSGNSTVAYAGGSVTFTPTSATAWQNNPAFFVLNVGDNTNNTATPADMADNYPVPWEADTLYRVVYSMVAPTALGETNPPDFYYIGGDVKTNELITNTYGTTKFSNASMPKQGTPQEFFGFWHGNGLTTAGSDYQKMRPHLSIGTVSNFIDNDGTGGNTGGIRVSAIRVEKVSF